MTRVPRLVVAAPASGCGKTTVATGLMAAWAAVGLTVSGHKVGPDYIDPGYHALATGRPGRNLDAWMCGPERIAPLFLHGAAGADLAVVEGVMGLYDGAAGRGELASTAQVAKLLQAPVVLVVDASAQARSAAALVHGFASFDPRLRIGGLILNRIGSQRHEELLREALADSGIPVLGALRRDPRLQAPSRHLGLVPAAERRAAARETVAALGRHAQAGCDLPGLLALARSAPPVPGTAWDPVAAVHGLAGGSGRDTGAARGERTGGRDARGGTVGARPGWGGRTPRGEPPGRNGSSRPDGAASTRAALRPRNRSRRPVVAVAGGAAFTFGYAEQGELLTAAGARVVAFDPLHDERLPEETAGLVIGGGFPEVYAPQLAENEPLRRAVAGAATAGMPVAAECAGLLYLADELDGRPMCGVLGTKARMSPRLTLGYREAVAAAGVLAAAGTAVRGHEFHRTVTEPAAGDCPAWRHLEAAGQPEGFVRGAVHASYLHLHWAAVPAAARRFVERCAT